jgi:prephenate dehydrogenase
MWRDIAIANRPALLQAIDLFSEHLLALRSAIDEQQADTLLATFSRAKDARDAFAAELAARGQRSA